MHVINANTCGTCELIQSPSRCKRPFSKLCYTSYLLVLHDLANQRNKAICEVSPSESNRCLKGLFWGNFYESSNVTRDPENDLQRGPFQILHLVCAHYLKSKQSIRQTVWRQLFRTPIQMTKKASFIIHKFVKMIRNSWVHNFMSYTVHILGFICISDDFPILLYNFLTIIFDLKSSSQHIKRSTRS